uniref:Ion_trans domain-containing protein n=1 Tax=Macrostomum lignano TaxID=282301 RepID=A0A1I8F6T5_9PLAT
TRQGSAGCGKDFGSHIYRPLPAISGSPAKTFVRVSDSVDDALAALAAAVGVGLRVPSMLVTVLGGPHSLVVTDGISEGIVRLTGRQSEDYNDAYGQSKINLLAVLRRGLPMELQDAVSTVLDANHNFFLMVDVGPPAGPAASAAISASRALALSQFRSRVESLLCRWPTEIGIPHLPADGSAAAPRQLTGAHLRILVNGSRDDLASLHSCVVTRRCSAVIVKSSGGLADLTCQLLDLLYGEGRVQKPGGQEAILQASTGPLTTSARQGAGHPPPGEEEVQTLQQLLAARHLIEVFSVEDDMASDFDGKILASLLGMSYSDAEEAESSALNLDQLRIAVSLDRSDIAKERVFTDTKQWKGHNVSMFKRLVGKRIDKDQEVMSTGLLCALLLRRLAQATDSVQEREELRLHADRFDGVHFLACMKCTIFESLSVAVLSECSKEDTGKTCLVLVRPVPHLEGASAFEIGAEGQSLSFIAHGSCQTVLDLMWRGGVTKRLSGAQFYFISLVGFFLPFFVTPLLRLMLHRAPRTAAREVRLDWSASVPGYCRVRRVSRRRPARRRSAVDLLDFGRVDGRPCVFDSPPRAHFLLRDGGCRPGRVSVSAASDARDPGAAGFEQGESGRLLSRTPAGQRNSCQRFVCDTYEFYSTPVIRFMYTSFAYAIFLALFTYVLLFAMGNSLQSWGAFHVILAVFVLSFLIEEAKQVLISGRSLADYLSTGWNLMDIVAIATFLLAGLVFGLRLVPGLADPVIIGPDSGSVSMLRICRILLGVSLFLNFCRLLQNFSVHVNLGPKVVMIQTMLRHCVRVQAELYKVPGLVGRYIAPVLLGFYTVFTNVLLLNLLIAMFANTYERIQSSSLQYWTLQRYLITRDFTERSVAPAPLSIFWNLAILLYIICKGRGMAFETDPVMSKI